MVTAARHRGVRPGMRRRLAEVAWRRHGAAVVSSLAAVSLMGYSSHPVGEVDVRSGEAGSRVDTVRAAMAATAPVTVFLASVGASVTEPGEERTATGGGTDDVPAAAFAAYRRAASVMAEAAPACELSWTLLAGIGRVESDHGRYGPAVLGDDGVSEPHIIGVALDGAGEVAEIRDSDGGALDGDEVWDRAVGPMQFLPSTWALVGVDGDGDGARNPHDLDDAALAAGVYLCAGGGDLSRPEDIRIALLRYNHSASYVDLVMAHEQGYRTGRFVLEAGTATPTGIVAADHGSTVRAAARRAPAASATAPTTTETVDRGATPAPAPVRPGPLDDSARSADAAKPAAPDATPDPDPAPAPAPAPDTSDVGTPKSAAPSAAPSADPVADPVAIPTGDPAQDPDRDTVTGLWTVCDEGYCLDGTPLLLDGPEPDGGPETDGEPELDGEPEPLVDYDGDGEAEDRAVELVGLVGTTVVVVVDKQETGWTVFAINGLAWPPTASPGA